MKKTNPIQSMGSSLPNQLEIISYLNGTIDNEKRRSLEIQLTNDEFLGDAIEGLKEIQSDTDLNILHSTVAYSIKRNLNKTKSKNNLQYPIWMIVLTMGLIFSLVVIGYWIISTLINS